MSQKQLKRDRRMMRKIVRSNQERFMAQIFEGLGKLGLFKRIVVAVKIIFH